MAKSLVSLALLLAAATCVALPHDMHANSLPKRVVILPTSEAPKLMKQCSRESPANVTGFWAPSVADVLRVEKRLPKFLRGASHHAVPLSGSCRQYVGVVSGDRKIIYVNVFRASTAAHLKEADIDWRITAVIVCDGGPVFWGVEYDVGTTKFEHLEFNGAI